jgi:undecaprenyl-diphosphatase
MVVGIDLVVTGFVLWSTRFATPTGKTNTGFKNPILIGVAQALAIMPGISRSGSTIAAAMWLRFSPEAAAEFSFIMAIPAIAGAAVLQLPDLATAGSTIGVLPLLVGSITALFSGIGAILLLVALLRKGAFHSFAPYCWALGAGVLGWQWLS